MTTIRECLNAVVALNFPAGMAGESDEANQRARALGIQRIMEILSPGDDMPADMFVEALRQATVRTDATSAALEITGHPAAYAVGVLNHVLCSLIYDPDYSDDAPYSDDGRRATVMAQLDAQTHNDYLPMLGRIIADQF